MTDWLSDATVRHLRSLGDAPDLGLPRYRILGRLGEGGMGEVWLADDRELDRPVAIKVLSDVAPAGDAAARMVQEARILAQLEHPGIVPVHEVGTLPDGRVYYVMKRVRGERLDRLVGPDRSLAWKLGTFQRVCETVAFAHAAGVVHRDLKPENIMVGEFGEVLVLDWGVAKRLVARSADEPAAASDVPATTSPASAPVAVSGHTTDSTPGPAGGGAGGVHTGHGAVLGTPSYMAPEQQRGESARVDERTDVYALGALLYYLLAGRPPVQAAAPGGDGAIPLRKIDPRIPAALESISRRAMAHQAADRYAGALDLAADVARFQAGERVRAHRERWNERFWRVAGKYRVPILVVIAYVVVRVILLVVSGR